jgi:hypothetical protein
MPRGRSRRWLIPGVALLACAGVWVGHTLEYVRVWGWSGLDREMAGSAHLYMVPVGLALTVLLAGAAGALLSFQRRLRRRADGAFGLLARAWRGRTVVPRRPVARIRAAPGSTGRLILSFGAALAVLQVGLYLIQENVESAAAGLRMPGLSAITGVHWAASLIHAGVALVLAAISVALWSLFRRREAAVERIEQAVHGVLAALAERRVRPLLPPFAPLRLHGAPAFLGASIWCRPPPGAQIP